MADILPPHEPDLGRTGNPAQWCDRCRIEAKLAHFEPEEDTDPYEVLGKELTTGQIHAEGLVRHLQRMGAACGTMPVEIDGEHYLVVVEKPNVRGAATKHGKN